MTGDASVRGAMLGLPRRHASETSAAHIVGLPLVQGSGWWRLCAIWRPFAKVSMLPPTLGVLGSVDLGFRSVKRSFLFRVF